MARSLVRIGQRVASDCRAKTRSGTWRITWVRQDQDATPYPSTRNDLFERQLNAFVLPRLFLLDAPADCDLTALRLRVASIAVGPSDVPTAGDADVAWDGGLLSRVALQERLQLVQSMDRRLKVGGSCIVIIQDHSSPTADLGFALSPEEVAAYFFPAYVVQRHEEHKFALAPADGASHADAVTFHTLVLLKQFSITSEALDLNLHRSLHAVARRRREMR